MKTSSNRTTKRSLSCFCVRSFRHCLSKTITLIFLSLSVHSHITKAQPCNNPIDGFAAAAGVTGGAGGQNIVVTNLNSSGPGSLKEAIAQSGPRIITFTPGLTGTINFTNVVYVDFPDMTIDGALANITISGFSLSVHKANSTPVQNVIIKNLTFGNTTPERSAIRIEFGSSNIWVDHCTFYNNSVGNTGQGLSIWDRGLGFNGLTGITVSWNHFKTPNKKSILIGSETNYTGSRISIHNNWFEGVDARNPRVHSGMLVHMWNNYLSNWVEYGVGVSDGADLLSQNDIFEKNGGIAVNPAYGGVNANSVNVTGSYKIGNPLPTIGTIGIFPMSMITYIPNIKAANDMLKQRIILGAGANHCDSGTTGVLNTEFNATVFSLSQNYPNPFNPVTNINFSIPISGNVKLTVFDAMGRQVNELVNQYLSAGTYKTDFNASELSSGVYFYIMVTSEFIDVKKMMLVK